MGIIVTNSTLTTFARCPRQYFYKVDQMLAPNRFTLPLKRGSWLHELLEAKYKTGDWRKRHRQLTKEFMKLFEEEREYFGDLPDICYKIMESYDFHWRHEDAEFEVLAVEEEFEYRIPHGHLMKFKIDAIVKDSWGTWLMEHKSHKTLPGLNYRFLDIQTARYFYGLKKLGWELDGVLWNYIRTKPPSVPKLTKKGRLSLAKLDTDLITYVRALKSYGLNLSDHRDKINALKSNNTFFRRERVPKDDIVVQRLVREAVAIADTIERGYKPTRSIERSCEFSCSFLDICMSDLYGGNTKAIIRQKFHTRAEGEYYGDTFEDQG